MKYYLEITLIENNNITLYEQWSKIYTQIHLAFVEQKNSQNKICYGVSFPEYRFNEKAQIGFLGGKLRVFAETEAQLVNLDLPKWLAKLADYVHLQVIKAVPSQINGYAVYRRKQVKTNAARLARRSAKRNNISFDEALQNYQNVVTSCDLPFVQIQSLSSSSASNKNFFKLFVEKLPASSVTESIFNTYGLSVNATVPEF